MIYGWFYRSLMKLAHRFHWHHTAIYYPDGDKLEICNWCGLRKVTPGPKRVADYEPVCVAAPHSDKEKA